jgi:uncharacterized cupin superfamily protein
VSAPKGAGSPRHRHHCEDEAWYILDGQLTFWLGNQELTASAGAFVFGPRDVEHGFRVDSAEARFLLLLTPAGFEDFTRACGYPATAATMPTPDLPQRNPRGARRRRENPWDRHRRDALATNAEGDKVMISSYKASSDIDVLTSSFPIPGFGLVPSVIDPADLKLRGNRRRDLRPTA